MGGSTKRSHKKSYHYGKRIGEHAIQDFYSNYRDIKRSMEREEHLREPQTAFLAQCVKQNLIPVPFGLVNHKGEEHEINLKNYRMGDEYADAFGHGL